MTTIHDVARHAGVGAATVSRVLSGKGYVKLETRERVMQSIRKLNYTPNEMARNLYFRKSGIIAVIVPDLSHPFFSEVVNAIEAALREEGYQTMVCNSFSDRNYELRYLEMLKRQQVDGIIFGAHTSLASEQYRNLERPVIGLDRRLADNIPIIAADHEEGGRLAAEEMLRSGCKKIIQLGDIEDSVATLSIRRHAVFREIVEEAGISCLSYPKHPENYTFDAFYETAACMFAEYPDTDGVFGTDLYAAAALRYALEHGIRVPEDLKIIGYDGTEMMRFLYPDITLISQPIEDLAKESVRMITEMIRGKEIPQKRVVLPITLRRGSTTAGDRNAAADSI
ncbi:MAG: LacI family DNA-binding transcriptional regulator [Eubacteriales bacterium]|nr:LacI family DNA-binding transcriptional regulator [Lachnospiraceae bacterium]MDO4416846.1 LacI family DNA-binding transcriptional regulator [Eubacteriales bacterium]